MRIFSNLVFQILFLFLFISCQTNTEKDIKLEFQNKTDNICECIPDDLIQMGNKYLPVSTDIVSSIKNDSLFYEKLYCCKNSLSNNEQSLLISKILFKQMLFNYRRNCVGYDIYLYYEQDSILKWVNDFLIDNCLNKKRDNIEWININLLHTYISTENEVSFTYDSILFIEVNNIIDSLGVANSPPLPHEK